MNYKTINFKLSITLLLVYELAMIFIGLNGVSIFKLVLTGFVWISFFIAFYEYIKYQEAFKKIIPYSAYIVLTLLLCWNVINVFRSIINKDGPITTILGNVAASLAVLIPFVIIFSLHKINLRAIHSYFINVIKFGILVFCIFFLLYGKNQNLAQAITILLLFSPVSFLIPGLIFESKKNRVIILISIVLLCYAADLFVSRTNLIRIAMLILCFVGLLVFYRFRFKWVLPLSCLVLVLPFLLLQQSYDTGESAFEKYLGDGSDNVNNVDTRTFLYLELYEDLINSNKMLLGKGGNGSYYSDYFYNSDVNETFNRNIIEVGILGILLKGGLVAVTLNLLLLFIAIYFAFFKSNNLYTIGIGYVLIVHTILLFLENVIIYSSYNFFIWFFIGVGLSKKIRGMSNKQIKRILSL